jgi:uncharacterized protein YrrD
VEKLYSNIIGTPIFQDDFPTPFTTVKDIIVDPDRGVLIAFVIDSNHKKVISSLDVIVWGDVIKINDLSAVADSQDILRVSEVQKKGSYIYGNKVESEKGEYIGKVFDFALNVSTGELTKIFSAKNILGLLKYDSRIIASKNIIEILPEKIVVKANSSEVKEKAKREISLEDMAVS